MFLATSWCLLALVMTSRAESWRWPEGAQSVRIDTKVRFVDTGSDNKNRDKNIQADEPPFEQPSDTDGFYNRPPGVGRYPVRVEPHLLSYRVDSSSVNQGRRQYHDSDGTPDSLRYCKCVSTDDCNARGDSNRECGAGKSLCCFKRPSKVYPQNSEVFNELEDERPMLFPGRTHSEGPFSHPGDVGYGHFGPNQQELLVGPGGPTGQVGPSYAHQLITPEGIDDRIGPNGNIGPRGPIYEQKNPAVLVGPNGPTGIIGPAPVNMNPRPDVGQSESAQRGVLVGPGGPTGFIGPYNQRPVLTGPGGPTGIIGPRGGRRGVLSGPGGPTGIIGPGYGRQSGPGVLIGPGGPTGVIGPGRQLLVGPGGPTGIIGPRYFESAPLKLKPKPQCNRNERKPTKEPLGKDVDHEVLDEHINPNTRVHHLGPPRAKRSYKITKAVQVRTVNFRRKPLIIRDVRVVPKWSKRILLRNVNGTNVADPKSIRELLRSVSGVRKRVTQSKSEVFSAGRGTNEGVLPPKEEHSSNGQKTINDALKSTRERFSTGLWTNGALRSKREVLSTGRGTKKRKLQTKRKLLRSVNRTNEADPRSIRELLSSVSVVSKRVTQSKRELFSAGRGTNEGLPPPKVENSRNGQKTIDDALKSMRERFSSGLWTNGALRSKREVLSTGRVPKKKLQSKRKLLRRVNMTNEKAKKLKRDLCTRGRTDDVKSIRRGRVRATTRNKRAPERQRPHRPRMPYRKQGSEDSFDKITEVPIGTTTRKKIGDKERIPVFMFMIKMLDFALRIIS